MSKCSRVVFVTTDLYAANEFIYSCHTIIAGIELVIQWQFEVSIQSNLKEVDVSVGGHDGVKRFGKTWPSVANTSHVGDRSVA